MERLQQLEVPTSIENTSVNKVRNIFYYVLKFHIILRYFFQ